MRALHLATVWLALTTSSCFAVTNLDRFDKKAEEATNFNDLRLSVRGMKSHVAELFEYRIVDSTNTIQSRGFIVPLGGEEATLFARGAVPKINGPFNLDFYADHDNSGGYDQDPANQKDHAWRIPLATQTVNDDGAYVIVFDHNTSFSYLANPAPPREVGSAATIRLTNVGSLVGKRVEVRVADASSKRVVGLYRIPVLPDTTGTVTMTIPGMIEAGVTYAVEVYTDDRVATPASIKAFRLEQISTQAGLEVDVDPQTAPVVTDVTPP
ncbi:MAG: hypothetical protein KF819_28055 [Labilithrix sp.]|nr:hypothetical protein [Labilithrix sp.]